MFLQAFRGSLGMLSGPLGALPRCEVINYKMPLKLQRIENVADHTPQYAQDWFAASAGVLTAGRALAAWNQPMADEIESNSFLEKASVVAVPASTSSSRTRVLFNFGWRIEGAASRFVGSSAPLKLRCDWWRIPRPYPNQTASTANLMTPSSCIRYPETLCVAASWLVLG